MQEYKKWHEESIFHVVIITPSELRASHSSQVLFGVLSKHLTTTCVCPADPTHPDILSKP